jgi:hypothetical protein
LKAPSFDPTEKRSWRIVDASFSLKRGMSHEVGDVRPAHFDEDFEGYYNGLVSRPIQFQGKTYTGGEVIPWGASFIRAIQLSTGEWKSVLSDGPGEKGEPVLFKEQIGPFSACEKRVSRRSSMRR